jgi:hypothetical protein
MVVSYDQDPDPNPKKYINPTRSEYGSALEAKIASAKLLGKSCLTLKKFGICIMK